MPSRARWRSSLTTVLSRVVFADTVAADPTRHLAGAPREIHTAQVAPAGRREPRDGGAARGWWSWQRFADDETTSERTPEEERGKLLEQVDGALGFLVGENRPPVHPPAAAGDPGRRAWRSQATVSGRGTGCRAGVGRCPGPDAPGPVSAAAGAPGSPT